jgi:hypothetical protein
VDGWRTPLVILRAAIQFNREVKKLVTGGRLVRFLTSFRQRHKLERFSYQLDNERVKLNVLLHSKTGGLYASLPFSAATVGAFISGDVDKQQRDVLSLIRDVDGARMWREHIGDSEYKVFIRFLFC